MDIVSVLLAFSAGLLSFLSPCVLPMIPAYLGYLAGNVALDISKGSDRARLIYKSIGFVAGFSIVFILLGLSFSTAGKFFSSYHIFFRIVGGTIIIIMGIHISGLIRIPFLYYEKRVFLGDKLSNAASVIVGMSFAAGWTPCIGPILSSILIYAGNMATVAQGVILLSVYSLGLAVPFILSAALFENFGGAFKKISRYMPAISVISGVLLVIMGLLIITDKLTLISRLSNFIKTY